MVTAYVCFALTGLCCSLPGILLPEWHLQDGAAAFLFLAISCGAASGPLFVGKSLRRSVSLGFLSIATGCLGWASLHGGNISLGLLWGLGLGMIMTALSLMSGALSNRPAVLLMRMNFLWSLGASVCPIVMTPALRTVGVRNILLGLAGTGILLACVASSIPALDATVDRDRAPMSVAGLPFSLLLATVLGPGVESSAGAWLATYAHRYHGDSRLVLELPALFWGGLFASRTLSWLLPAVVEHWVWLRISLALTFLASLCLLFPSYSLVLCVASAAMGFGIGPIYPLLLAQVLSLRNNRLIFFLAGVSAATVPWATGTLSAQSGSLRVGLCAVCMSTFLLMACGWGRMKASGLRAARWNVHGRRREGATDLLPSDHRLPLRTQATKASASG